MAILGAGTGGMMMAHKLRKTLSEKEWNILIFDQSKVHYYQPAYIFIPFEMYGYQGEKDNAKPIEQLLPSGVVQVEDEIIEIASDKKTIKTKNGNYTYDWLIVSTGCRIAPEEVPGMTDGYGKNVFYFYTMKSAMDLRDHLRNFKKGRLVIEIAESPIKCPVAPIEFAALADSYFRERGIRKDVEIEVVTVQDSLFTKPVAGKFLTEIFERKDIKITAGFPISEVDAANRKIHSFTGQTVEYDTLVAIPPNVGADFIDSSGFSDGSGFVATDQNTLKVMKHDQTYALGDCTNLPTSKAGSVAHFEANIVEQNILRELEGKAPHADFDGHALCFIETGGGKASLIDFNYDHQPVPGKFPRPLLGPFSLLKEDRLNHWGKLFFRYYYWNILIPDRASSFMEIFVPTRLDLRGKEYDKE